MATRKPIQLTLFDQHYPAWWNAKGLHAHAGAMAALRRDGAMIKEIAAEFGCSETSVAMVLRRHRGVPPPPTRDAPWRKHHFDQRYFQTVDTEEKAYWLGFIAADGNVTGTTTRVALAEEDAAHVFRFARCVGYSGPVVQVDKAGPTRQDSVRVDLNSSIMACDLFRHGIPEAKSLVLEPWVAPNDHLQAAWFRGLFDGDGGIQINTKHGTQSPYYVIELTGTRAVAQAFLDFVGARVHSPRLARRTARRRGNVYRAFFGGREVVSDVLRVLYAGATISLERKRVLAARIMADRNRLRRWKHVTAAEWQGMRDRAGSWKEVARQLGLRDCKLSRYLVRAGIRRRDTSFRPTKEEMLELRRVHGSWAAVGRLVGRSDGAIRDRARRLGIYPTS